MSSSVDDNGITLDNSDLRVGFNGHGDLVSMESPSLYMRLFPNIDPSGEAGFGWGILFDQSEHPRWDWECTRVEKGEYHLHYEGQCDDVEIQVDVSLEGMGCDWEIHLVNGGRRTVEGLVFCLRGPFLFASDLCFTYPYCAGWSIPFSGIHSAEGLTLQYPVKAAMQWTSLFSGEQGVYLGVHDEIPYYKELTWGMEQDKPTVYIRFLYLQLASKQRLSIPNVHLALHADGWRGGARIYRSWARGHVTAPKVPNWYKERPSWAWVGLKEQHAETFLHVIDDLPDVSRQVSEAGLNLIQLTAYTEDGHDTLYPDYVPGKKFGGIQGLQNAVEAIHAIGGRISIYVNGRIVDPASSLEEEKRFAWAVRETPDAPPLKEIYGKVTFDVMCPGAVEWQEHFAKKLVYLVRTFDIDGIYIDQVCAARSYPCYAVDHDHERPCLAWSRYREFMSELREQLLKTKSDLFLATEGINDLLGQYFDSMQSHNDWPIVGAYGAKPLHDLYLYTFPEHLFNVGCITEQGLGEYYLKIAHLTGSGCDFGVQHWERMSQKLLHQTKWVLDWHAQHYATFRLGKRLPVTTNISGVDGCAYLKGSKLVVNGAWLWQDDVEDVEEVIMLRVENFHGQDVETIEASDSEGVIPCKWKVTGSTLEMRIPTKELFGMLVSLE